MKKMLIYLPYHGILVLEFYQDSSHPKPKKTIEEIKDIRNLKNIILLSVGTAALQHKNNTGICLTKYISFIRQN